MERRKSELLGNVLQRFLREEGLETPIFQHRLMSVWPEVVGMEIATATLGLRISNQTLLVQLSAPTSGSKLMMHRAAFVSKLNERVGAQVIADIKIV